MGKRPLDLYEETDDACIVNDVPRGHDQALVRTKKRACATLGARLLPADIEAWLQRHLPGLALPTALAGAVAELNALLARGGGGVTGPNRLLGMRMHCRRPRYEAWLALACMGGLHADTAAAMAAALSAGAQPPYGASSAPVHLALACGALAHGLGHASEVDVCEVAVQPCARLLSWADAFAVPMRSSLRLLHLRGYAAGEAVECASCFLPVWA